MKKNEIYVVINSEKKRQKALQILSDANEKVFDNSILKSKFFTTFFLVQSTQFKKWGSLGVLYKDDIEVTKTEITLEKLESILSTMRIDELKAQAEMLGFELVKKERNSK
jgi:hypothetical protein